ncbi:GNAT family N-acetyltransferase [Psychroserpens sp. MEBiC05023]
MNKILKRFRIVDIDVFVYKIEHQVKFDLPDFSYDIKKSRLKNKWYYSIINNNTLVHASYLYDSVYLLRLLKRKGPVIGDCFTHKAYRGQSIYPYVINSIASENLSKGLKEIFIIVNQKNISSIKGIEKAGFSKFVAIKGSRWLWFYLKKQITHF